ncbi:OLC1v1025565C1 [Oldenlandia corymbosa var. corymbosa]|uniref:OLC1v1025565C1 n=1 Tax=Oldenlandia corymbosa var. corymbosa TaxID=529605 RepID=A0AAV1C6K3_OLDCO|nr:OLC1v1025565C1 [Oldenlandia corymbosa var. corymbosa]
MTTFVDHYVVLGFPTGYDGVLLSDRKIRSGPHKTSGEMFKDFLLNIPDLAIRRQALKSFRVLTDMNSRLVFNYDLLNRYDIDAGFRELCDIHNDRLREKEAKSINISVGNKQASAQWSLAPITIPGKSEAMEFVDHYAVLGLPTGYDGIRVSLKEIRSGFMIKARRMLNIPVSVKQLMNSCRVLSDVNTRNLFNLEMLRTRLKPDLDHLQRILLEEGRGATTANPPHDESIIRPMKMRRLSS